jgi:hypothetical protein
MSRYRHAGDKGKRMCSSCSFLTLASDGVSGQRHAPATLFPRGKNPGTHWIGGWVGLRVGLDTEARGKILCRGSNPCRPVCSQTLYWLLWVPPAPNETRPNLKRSLLIFFNIVFPQFNKPLSPIHTLVILSYMFRLYRSSSGSSS